MNELNDWSSVYQATLARLGDHTMRMRPVLLGLAVTVDAIHHLDAAAITHIEKAASQPGPHKSMADSIWRRIYAGEGGELRVAELTADGWPDGPDWLGELGKPRFRAGGAAGQAANTLSALGIPALLALTNRTKRQLDVLADSVQIGQTDGSLIGVRQVQPYDQVTKKPHHVLEFQAGTQTEKGTEIHRSDRIIIRFEDSNPECDEDFMRAAIEMVAQNKTGAGLISGMSQFNSDQSDEILHWVSDRVRQLRKAGLRWLHLEMAPYPNLTHRDRVLGALTPWVNSLGMNETELIDLAGGDSKYPAQLAVELADWYGLDRVNVHSDRWTLSVTRDDPVLEYEALLTASLVATARAEAGEPVLPTRLPAEAFITTEVPATWLSSAHSQWKAVVVPTLYLAKPHTTVGLGDTFMAATLAMLGANPGPAANS